MRFQASVLAALSMAVVWLGAAGGCAWQDGHGDMAGRLGADPPAASAEADGAVEADASAVRCWTETVTIPTYPIGPTSGVPQFVQTDHSEIYPYAMQDDLRTERRDQQYEMVKLENRYLRVEVLPALGGKVFAIYDKVSGQDVVYRQESIKPALVAMRGAWTSGGIEWNFPDGHIVTTCDPVSVTMLRNADGSASIVIGDTERIFRMGWTVVLTLHPDRAYVDSRIVCRNRTPYRHRFSWWTNASFPANDEVQMIFPVWKVTGHDGRRLEDWPSREGQDVSWYSAHQGASSIFRAAGEEDFMAAYDHGRDVGLGQVADRRVMPGRKFWSWGVSDAGRRWASILSDDHRPYIEVQSGLPLLQNEWRYIEPYETHELREVWMPISRIGVPVRMNREAVVRMTVADGVVELGVLPTRALADARIVVETDEDVLGQWQESISPEAVFRGRCELGDVDAESEALWLRVSDGDGREVIAHQYGRYERGEPLIEASSRGWRHEEEAPRSADAVAARAAQQEQQGNLPNSIATLVKGREAFGDDAAIALALGIARLKQGLTTEARDLLDQAVTAADERVDADEAQYYLGLSDVRLGETDSAMARWGAIARGSAYGRAAALEMAKVYLSLGEYHRVPNLMATLGSVAHGGGLDSGSGDVTAVASPMAHVVASMAWRRLDRPDKARVAVGDALRIDPMGLLAQVELAVLDGRGFGAMPALRDEERRIEAATTYAAVGDYTLADQLLDIGSGASVTATYLRAWVAEQAGNPTLAAELRAAGSAESVRGAMPSRLESLAAFEAAVAATADDANAHYLAGLVLMFKVRPDEARAHWQRAVELRDAYPVAHWGLAKTAADEGSQESINHLARALSLAPDEAKLYTDLDDACRVAGDTDRRVTILRDGLVRLPHRSDVAHLLGVACFDAGRYDEAVEVYQSHQFHVAENRYELHGHYVAALMGRATTRLRAGRYADALIDLHAAMEYPENLNIGRPEWDHGSATVDYWRGVAWSKLGQDDSATRAWESAAKHDRVFRWMRFQRPEMLLDVLHGALAQQRLGRTDEAGKTVAAVLSQCDEFADVWPPHGRAVADMVRAYAAGVRGQSAEAADLLAQSVEASKRYAGVAEIVRMWLTLLDADGVSVVADRLKDAD